MPDFQHWTLDVFPCHGVGGMTGVFVKEKGLLFGETKVFLTHLLALIGISIFCVLTSFGLYWITNKLAPLRVEKEHEIIGLDLILEHVKLKA